MDNALKLRILGQEQVNKKDILTHGYKKWRQMKRKTKEPFFAVYKDLAKHLHEIETGPLKLYIYYGFAAGNEDGSSWHSSSTIADKLMVNKKTVEAWNKKLEEYGLVYRVFDGKPTKTTYLLPLSDYAHDMGSKQSFDAWVTSDDFRNTYGEICSFFVFTEKKGTRYDNYHVVEVSIDYGTFNKRKVYYYYISKALSVIPSIEDIDALDDKIYKQPSHDQLGKIGTRDPICWFINDGADLSRQQDLMELTQDLGSLSNYDNFVPIDWEVKGDD